MEKQIQSIKNSESALIDEKILEYYSPKETSNKYQELVDTKYCKPGAIMGIRSLLDKVKYNWSLICNLSNIIENTIHQKNYLM